MGRRSFSGTARHCTADDEMSGAGFFRCRRRLACSCILAGSVGRLAEDGAVPDRYQLTEVDGSYRQRTRRNVCDSDATLIVSIAEELSGGTLETRKYVEKIGKPWLHVCP